MAVFSFIIILVTVRYCSCVIKSEYIKTSVSENICLQISNEKALYAETLFQCSILCSENSTCRRFLYCSNPNSTQYGCSLFDSGEHCITPIGTDDSCQCFRKKYTCGNGSCLCPVGYYGDECQSVIKDCLEANTLLGLVKITTILAFIQPNGAVEPFEVECLIPSNYTRLALRLSRCSSFNFNRSYTEYVNGFGTIGLEYWIGLENMMHILRLGSMNVLNIGMVPRVGSSLKYHKAVYTDVHITNASTGYAFFAGNYVDWGTPAGDALLGNLSINGTQFSTFDQDYSGYNCSSRFGGGWWFASDPRCSWANPNGPHSDRFPKITWLDNFGNNEITKIQIRVRRLQP